MISTKRIQSTGDAANRGSIAARIFNGDKTACRYCGKLLKCARSHDINVAACDAYKKKTGFQPHSDSASAVW